MGNITNAEFEKIVKETSAKLEALSREPDQLNHRSEETLELVQSNQSNIDEKIKIIDYRIKKIE